MDFFYKAVGAVLAPFRYAQRELENAKENLKDDAREAVSNVLKIILIMVCSLFFLTFCSISAATAINSSSESAWLGYVSVAGFYLVMAVGVWIWRQLTRKQKEAATHNN